MCIIIWNCQEAGIPFFLNVFILVMDKYKHTLVILLEPWVSEIKADDAIRKTVLIYSHHIEATDFSGGIWFL